MSSVLVTGGTGHLGRDIVPLLVGHGHQVRVLARRPPATRLPDTEWVRGDLATGSGIAEAIDGVDTIVHAATHSPAAQRGTFHPGDFVRSPDDVDINGTRQLLAAAYRAGVEHFVHISVVGVRQSRVPYSRVKAAAEDLVRESRVPWSIVAATGFYWLLARMLDRLAKHSVWPLPSNLDMQACDSGDFAGYVVQCLADGPLGQRPGFGGPETLSVVELARQYQSARGLRRRILPLALPRFALRAAGPQTCPDGRHGTTTWSSWLATHG